MLLMAGRKFAGKSSLDGHISRIKDRYFPAKKPKFKKIYSSIKKLKKDGKDLIERGPSSKLHLIYMSIMNQLNKGHGESCTREIETYTSYTEEISSRTIEAYTIIDQSEEGSGYNSVDSYPLSASSDLDASRDEHTSWSAASSHLISSIGTTSLSSHPQLFRRVDFNSSQASFSTEGDLGFTHSSSEAKFLDKDQEVPLNTFDELVDDFDVGSNLESFYALSSISDFLDIDNFFFASEGVNDDFRHGATQNEDQSCESFASRENLESYLDSPDAELFSVSVEITNQYVREILKSTLNNSKDIFFMRKASPGSVCDSQFSELEVPEHLNLPSGVTIENHSEPLNFTKTEKENVDDADNTPCGSDACEDAILPEPTGTPELLGASYIAEEPWQETLLRTSKEWKANMIQWIAESFPSANISVSDEIETESPGPAPVTSPDVCPVFVSTNREVDGALWDGDRPSSSHLLGDSANEIETAEDVRGGLPGMTHGTSASHITGAGAQFNVPAAWPHETFLQHSSTRSQERCYDSFPGFSQLSTKHSSPSMPSYEKKNVCKLLQRSGGRAKARFKRSFSEPLAREQREPAVVILPRGEERPEEVFLPVLEVYSTLHPPQEVPRVDNHGPILQETFSEFLDDIDQSELDNQIQHALHFGIPLPSDVDVNERVIDIRASKRMLRLSRL